MEGKFIGLIEELTGYFTRQLDLHRSLNDTCPGEEPCSMIGRIEQERQSTPSLPILEICQGCPMKDTKPGSEPEHLTDAIATALGLDELKQTGATFAYPGALNVFEWACSRSLQRARVIDQEQERKRSEEQSHHEAGKNRLEALRRR